MHERSDPSRCHRAELKIGCAMPPEVIVLLFAAGEIFTKNRVRAFLGEDEIFTKPIDDAANGATREYEDVIEDLDHTTWEDWLGSGQYLISPESFSELSLKRQCRLTIRGHLLDLDLHENLFNRVLRLGLPQRLARYLLYNVSLDAGGDDSVFSL